MLGFFDRKPKTNQTVISRISDSFMGWLGAGAAAPTLSHESAVETAAVLCAVKSISESVAAIPIDLKRREVRNGLTYTTPVNNHWAVDLLNRPNSYMTRQSFIETMTAHMILGRGALAVKTTVGGKVKELLPVLPSVWTLEVLDNGNHQFRINLANGQQAVLHPSQCLYIHGVGIDGYSGISSIQKAREVIGITNTLSKQSLDVAANGGRPAGILTFDAPLSPEQRDSLRTAWQSSYGNGGTGTAILDGGAKYSAMSMSHVEGQHLESRQHQIAEIARVFKIPAPLLFNGEKIDADVLRYFHQHTLKPYFVRFEEVLKRDLLANEPDHFFDFADEELLRASPEAQANYFKQALGAGGSQAWLSLNDVRAALFLDPIDEPWAKVPSQGGYELSAKDKVNHDPEEGLPNE